MAGRPPWPTFSPMSKRLRAARPSPMQADALLAGGLALLLVGARAFEAHGLQRAGWLGYTLSVLPR